MNPRGRTGAYGIGTLSKWGPNHALDVMVTRRDPQTSQMQMIVIRRDDGSFGVPGAFSKDFGTLVRVRTAHGGGGQAAVGSASSARALPCPAPTPS